MTRISARARAGSRAVDADPPRARLALAREHLDQLLLAVAGDAGDADDLARAHLEAQLATRAGMPRSSCAVSPSMRSTTSPRARAWRVPVARGGSSPTIMRAIASGVRSATRPRPARRPRRSTVTSSANCITSRNLCEIMSTVRRPSLAIPRSRPSTSSASDGRQHRRRLVEDDDACCRGRAASGSRASASRPRRACARAAHGSSWNGIVSMNAGDRLPSPPPSRRRTGACAARRAPGSRRRSLRRPA